MKNRRNFLKKTSLLLASASVFGYQAVHSTNHIISMDVKEKEGMLQHTVYFWVKTGLTKNEKKTFEKGLKELVSNIKEVKKAEIGIPAQTPVRDVVDKSFGYSIFVWFKSLEDHNIYQEHPVHAKFIKECSGFWTKVQVYDSEIL